MAREKKFLTLFESYFSRYERGGFLVGDVFKFNDGFKSTEGYKKLGQNTKDMIDQMIESGLHVRVVGIKDTTSPRYPGNPQTSSTDVELTLALDNGGGRYTHYERNCYANISFHTHINGRNLNDTILVAKSIFRYFKY